MELHEHEAFTGITHVEPRTAASLVKSLAKYDTTIRAALQRGDVAAAVSKAFTSRWSGISKAVQGGLQFIIAADNGASYAELWSGGNPKDANWYAVTGAGIHEVTDIKKGMPLNEAFDRFVAATVGKAECLPCSKRRSTAG